MKIKLTTGDIITVNGPVTYNWHEVMPNEIPDISVPASFNHFMTYNALRTWNQGKPSINQTLPPHPSQLPWQN